MERVVGRLGYDMRMTSRCAKLVRMIDQSREQGACQIRRLAGLGASSLALMTVATMARSQEPSSQHLVESHQDIPLSAIARRLQVTVALSDTLPGDRPAILRRPGTRDANVILLPSGTVTEVGLPEAIVTILTAHHGRGDLPSNPAVLRSRDGKVPRLWSPVEVGRASRVLSRLRAAQPSYLEGVGRVRHLVIYLSEDALRGRLRQRQR